jgi:penicillin-binding protein 2
MTAIVGARGKNFQPRLVTALRDPVTRATTPLEPRPLQTVEVASPEQWQIAIDSMLAVMEGGTATRSAAGAPYRIAGKTGTAQVFTVGQNEKYDEKTIDERLRDHAWFVAFAPAEDPKIAVAVLVENGRSGSGTAAPIARRIMDAYLLRKFDDPATPAPAAVPQPAGGE